MNARTTLLTGITFAGLGVAIGAFGAHGLKPILEQTGRVETFELAVRYQFYHAFALLIAGMLMSPTGGKAIRYAPGFFVAGIFLFSGSLYALSLSGVRILGMITPLGGVAFIAGWVLLFIGVYQQKRPQ